MNDSLQSLKAQGAGGRIEAQGQASGTSAGAAMASAWQIKATALGVNPARLRAVGKGSSEPVNVSDPLAADNRRVRVVTLE